MTRMKDIVDHAKDILHRTNGKSFLVDLYISILRNMPKI